MSWLNFFKAAQAGDLVLSFDALASVGTLPMAIGPDGKGKIKDPQVNGRDWGKMTIDQRREKLVDFVSRDKRIGLGCQPIGYVVVDIDPPDKNRDLLEPIQDEFNAIFFGGDMPATLTIGTQAGRHFWFKATRDFVRWWGDHGKRKIMLSNGAAIDLFLGISTKQTQVAVPPSDGKEIEVEMEPAELPVAAANAIMSAFEKPDSKEIPPAAVNVASQSDEEDWFIRRTNKIITSIANAVENTRHDRFRGGMVAIAGYAAGVGCNHLKDWAIEQAKRAHKYAKPEVNDRVLELTAAWAWSKGSQWAMIPPWIEKKRSGQDYQIDQTESERQEPAQVQPVPKEMPDLTGFDNPHKLARDWLDQQGINRVVTWQGEFWQWEAGRYEPIPGEEMDARLSTWLDAEFARHAKELYFKTDDPKERKKISVKPVKPADVEAVKKAIASLTTKQIGNISSMPAWLDGVGNGWDVRDVICFKNAIVNPRIGAIDNLTSNLFSRYRTDYDWIDDAQKPTRFLKFLDEIWPNEKDCIEALQMFFGYCLTQDTRQQRIALLTGPPRSGKGTIARTLSAVVGHANVASPSLGDLAQPFGLAKCIGRPLAIIPDARIGNRVDQALIVERLLSISGEDRVAIDRKYKEAWEGRLPTRIMICSNELPRLNDTTGALSNRYLIMPMTKSFLGTEDKNLETDIMKELPGIVTWSIKGFQKLVKKGKFTQPASGQTRLDVLQELCSPVVAFINEKYQVTSNEADKIEADEMHTKWRLWCEKTGHHASSVHKFYKDLIDVYPAITKKKARINRDPVWSYTGIKEVSE